MVWDPDMGRGIQVGSEGGIGIGGVAYPHFRWFQQKPGLPARDYNFSNNLMNILIDSATKRKPTRSLWDSGPNQVPGLLVPLIL